MPVQQQSTSALSPEVDSLVSTPIQHMQKPGPLSNIPAELLLQILRYLGESELYSLALLSRRLHYCALPIYLERYGISDAMNLSTTGKVKLFYPNNDAALRGLRISLFTTSVKYLSCEFHFPEARFLWEIRNLYRLLAKLSHVDEFTVDFHALACDMASAMTVTQSIFNQWGHAFGRVINAIVVGKCCSSLTMRDWDLFGEASQGGMSAFPPVVKQRSTIARPFVAFRKLFTLRGSQTSRTTTVTDEIIHVRAVGSSSYTNTGHQNYHPFSPFMSWTIATLNNSNLTSLSLESTNLQDITIFPSISLPALSSLSIDLCRIVLSDFRDFLSRHHHITTLKLGDGFDILPSEPHPPATILPRLTSLSAPLDCLAYFLTRVDALPSLEHVCMLSHITVGSSVTSRDLTASVAHRVNQIDLSFKLWVHNSGEPTTHIDANHTATQGDKTCDPLRVTSLEIIGSYYHSDSWTPFPAWISSIFPSIESILFAEFPDWEDSWLDPGILAFANSICKHCVGIRTIGINEEVHSVSTWLELANRKSTSPGS